jgi:mono/diheme cytochrome c family protein
MRRAVGAAAMLAGLAFSIGPAPAAQGSDGKALLESNCGRCHAVAAGEASPLSQAPNLFTVLGSYPGERLEFELAEGIGSRHRDMPQIQFSGEDITSIYYYLHGKAPESELRRPQ